jgi:hypothetical protein
MTNKISSITRKDIFNLFTNGLDIDFVFSESQHVTYPYYGELTEIEFLKRLYNLKDMVSLDPRYSDAESDIWQHTQNNDDYDFGWVFTDVRFPLSNGSDEDILNFLCMVFHPEVRYEKGYWREYFNEVNRLLANDKFELYPITQISKRDVFGWRCLDKREGIYLPFSQRNKNSIKSKTKPTFKNEGRSCLVKLFQSFDEILYLTDETGLNYNSNSIKEAFNKLSEYYEPRCFNDEGKYCEAVSFDNFILKTSPYCVFDAIEIFSQFTTKEEYVDRVNALLCLYNIPYQLCSGLICDFVSIRIGDEQIGAAPEVGITELLQKAKSSFNQGDKQIAIEKLWDALERIKTIHSDCDKKQSVERIINLMANGDPNYYSLFEKEFKELTEIGNRFRIRHHETNKIEIDNDHYYNYFYGRCSSLIDLVLKFITII